MGSSDRDGETFDEITRRIASNDPLLVWRARMSTITPTARGPRVMLALVVLALFCVVVLTSLILGALALGAGAFLITVLLLARMWPSGSDSRGGNRRTWEKLGRTSGGL